MPIHFAPLQGYTDDAYRRFHHQLIGGVETYTTPFLRVEAGSVRSKDLRDIAPEYNQGVPVVPQIIFKSMKEFDYLLQTVESKGYTRVDLNMGCPFPLQAKHGRGSGVLAHLDVVQSLCQRISELSHLQFSVKMRLGWESAEEWRPVLQLLNQVPLHHITLHPRLGTQQYKGEVDMEQFRAFYDACRHPLLYNGDVTSPADIQRIENEFPRLSGLMIGRGLLARPTLAKEYAEGREMPFDERLRLLMQLHQSLHTHYQAIVNSEAQLHAKLRLMWEYLEPQLGKKPYKKIMKAGNLKNYLQAVKALSAG